MLVGASLNVASLQPDGHVARRGHFKVSEKVKFEDPFGTLRNSHPSEVAVLIVGLSYPAETVLSTKITRNRIVPSFKDSPRKPLGRLPNVRIVSHCSENQEVVQVVWIRIHPGIVWTSRWCRVPGARDSGHCGGPIRRIIGTSCRLFHSNTRLRITANLYT